jgi:hypothetical protein
MLSSRLQGEKKTAFMPIPNSRVVDKEFENSSQALEGFRQDNTQKIEACAARVRLQTACGPPQHGRSPFGLRLHGVMAIRETAGVRTQTRQGFGRVKDLGASRIWARQGFGRVKDLGASRIWARQGFERVKDLRESRI